MKLRYKIWFGALIIVFAAFMFLVGIVAGPLTLLFTGAILLAVGVLYAVQPCGELAEGRVVVYGLLGAKTVFAFESEHEVQLQDGVLMVKGQKLPLNRALVRGDDWKALTERLTRSGSATIDAVPG